MALKATVYKAQLQVADMDRHYYAEHALTLACHPSETEARLMVRVLAFALNAHEHLAFGRGLSTDDEPDLWIKDLTGRIECWIDVGQPSDKDIRQACARADRVIVYAYGGRTVVPLWWGQIANTVARLDNLVVAEIPAATAQALGGLAARGMSLSCTVQDGQVWVTDGRESIEVEVHVLKAAVPK